MDYLIKLGKVDVNTETVMHDLPDVKVLEIDLNSKYPGRCWYEHTADSVSVIIPAGPETLCTRDVKNETEVVFPLENSWDWSVIADGARYTVRIVLYRRKLS